MRKFDYDQTNSHRVINKRFGVEERWSYISVFSYCTDSLCVGGIEKEALVIITHHVVHKCDCIA